MSQASQTIFQGISLLLTQRRTAEARVELERLLALDPEDPEARSQAGDVYAYIGSHAAAYKQYNQAAETYNRLGRADMALAVHHKILELDPGSLDSSTQTRLRLLNLLVAAEDAIVAGQYEKAVAGYQEAIQQFPNHTISYQRLASLLIRLNRVEEAAEQYLIVARAFYAHGVRSKARPYFERALELKPTQEEALDSLLACLKADNREVEGLRFIRSALQAHAQAGSNEQAEVLLKLFPYAGEEAGPLEAAVLLQGGDVERAGRLAARLELHNPEIRALFKTLGRAALDRGDSASADAYFRWAQGQAAVQSAPAPPQPLPIRAAPLPSVPTPAPALAPLPPLPPLPLAPVAAPVPVAPLVRPSEPAPVPVPVAATPAPPAALPPAPPAPPVAASASAVSRQDRTVLRTMGEVCLAEGLFEEARQIFERLIKAQMDEAPYWELLKRARAGLELASGGAEGALAPPVLAEPAAVKAPVPPAPPSVEFQAAPAAPAAPARVFAPAPDATPPPLQPPPRVLVPVGLPKPLSRPLPAPVASRAAALPIPPSALASIVRTAYVMQLGELPPPLPGAFDDYDELIE